MIPEKVKKQAENISLETFRGADFVNREQEQSFWFSTFFSTPYKIHFVYGPKSSGKTTLLEKVRDQILSNKKLKPQIAFFWFDLREQMLSNYYDVVDFLFEVEKSQQGVKKRKVRFSGGLYPYFLVDFETGKEIANRRKNIFRVIDGQIDRLVRRGKKVVVVLDEIQQLKEIYLNGGTGRTLLNELLNYFVRITKVDHKAQVICMSSNAFFIEELYNNSTLEKTAEFVLVDYLSYPAVYRWLKHYGFEDSEIETIWEKAGSDPFTLRKLIETKHNWLNTVKTEIHKAKAKIIDSINTIKPLTYRKKVINYLSQFVKNGGRKALTLNTSDEDERDIVQFLADREILFFDPLKNEVRVQFKTHLYALKEIFNTGGG